LPLESKGLTIRQTPAYTSRPQIQASASCSVPVYSIAFAGTHSTYPLVYLLSDGYLSRN